MAKMTTPAMERINKRRAKNGGKIKRSTPGRDAWRRLIRNRPAILGMVIIIALHEECSKAEAEKKAVEMLEDNRSVSALVPLTVINTANFELPKTGGRGNKLLYGMGILALLAAVGSAVVLTRKRRA